MKVCVHCIVGSFRCEGLHAHLYYHDRLVCMQKYSGLISSMQTACFRSIP